MAENRFKLLQIYFFFYETYNAYAQEFIDKLVERSLQSDYKYGEENRKIFEQLRSQQREKDYIKHFKFDKYPEGGFDDSLRSPRGSFSYSLTEGFETAVIYSTNFSDDSRINMKEAVEIYQPDLIMYCPVGESHTMDSIKQAIPENLEAYPEIPRVSSINFDRISPLFSAGMMLAKELNSQANFATSIINGEFDWLPVSTYYLPQSFAVNNNVFKDYRQKKEFTLGLFGSGYFNDTFYPWRQKVVEKVLGKYPLVHFPQPYHTGRKHIEFPRVVGENYSRMINRCQFSLVCGSVVNTILAKHFEVPASGTCLLTEDSKFLREHGFIDGENCVCVTPDNVEKKIDYYLTNLDLLAEITEAGRRFVVERYCFDPPMNNVLNWFKVWKECGENEEVVQTGIFEFQAVVEGDTSISRLQKDPDILRQFCDQGFAFLQRGEISQAQKCFADTLAIVGYEPLGRLGMALVNIFSGNAGKGLQYLDATFAHEHYQGALGNYHDPVELAYYIIATICAGDKGRAYNLACMWNTHTHYALEAARQIAAAVNSRPEIDTAAALSVHSRCPVIISSVQGWLNHFRDVFKIYGLTI